MNISKTKTESNTIINSSKRGRFLYSSKIFWIITITLFIFISSFLIYFWIGRLLPFLYVKYDLFDSSCEWLAINLPLSLVVHDFLKDSNDISFKWLENRRNEAIHYMIPKNQEENKVLLRKLQFLNNSNINKLTNNELIILSRSLEEIITHDKADIVILGNSLVNENINTLKISSHFIERLAKNLKRENNKISFMAIVTLKKIGKRAKVSIPLLKEFINHSNPLFRHQALEAIWNIIDNKDKLKNIVLERLLNDKNPDVKMLASHLLIKDDISLDLEDLQKLKELYKEKLYDSVKENLCLIFGKHLKVDSDLSSILQSSLNYSYPGIRKAAAMGLAQTLDKKYIPVLKNAYKKEGVKSVKEELEKAINKLNFSNCTGPRKTGVDS